MKSRKELNADWKEWRQKNLKKRRAYNRAYMRKWRKAKQEAEA